MDSDDVPVFFAHTAYPFALEGTPASHHPEEASGYDRA
jgi:hypothetical protein